MIKRQPTKQVMTLKKYLELFDCYTDAQILDSKRTAIDTIKHYYDLNEDLDNSFVEHEDLAWAMSVISLMKSQNLITLKEIESFLDGLDKNV